jgi:hypothetical protein
LDYLKKSPKMTSVSSLRLDPVRHRRRWLLYGLLAFAVVALFLVYQSAGLASAVPLVDACDPDPPANWDRLYKWEDDLPQHDVDLPFPEGGTGRYVYFKNQIQYLGWNNMLNEMYVYVPISI